MLRSNIPEMIFLVSIVQEQSFESGCQEHVMNGLYFDVVSKVVFVKLNVCIIHSNNFTYVLMKAFLLKKLQCLQRKYTHLFFFSL